eukprot:Phypoly_transcript_08732.p1 GENE.Phypoly_transcript_08732~~Phypoly_transcript_08732.p1  ORF type:complete len:487 (+),score=82.06 Phypoly_transcript_08732:53-1462(+)
MDCFYVSVTTRDKPQMWKVPVAVSPAGRQGGTSEIACCNYPARNLGIKSRMLVKDALVICPDLLILTCEFEKYQKVSEKIFDIFFEVTTKVQALSVDEALLDITNCGNPEEVAQKIRNQIFEKTGCTASAGIGSSIMIAKLATRKAKPNGQLYVPDEKVLPFLQDIPVNLLPGVGEAITEKLGTLGVKTIGQLSQIPQGSLKEHFGEKKGNTLFQNAKGIDDTPLKTQHERKSVGTQISWGIRCEDMKQVNKLLRDVSIEVANRLKDAGGQAKRVCLRVKRHKEGMADSEKLLNPGHVVAVSKSGALPTPTQEPEVIVETTIKIYQLMNIPPNELRGIGLSVDLASPEELKKNGASQSLNSFFEKKNTNATPTIPNNTNNNNVTNFVNINSNITKNPSNATNNISHATNNLNNQQKQTQNTNATPNNTSNNKINSKRKGDNLESNSKKPKPKQQGDLLHFFQQKQTKYL